MRSPKQAGFSLFELLVVIAVAGILAAMAVPAFTSQVAKRRLEGAAGELSADLQYARSQAVADNTNVTFASSGGTAYSITGNQTYKTVTLGAGLSITNESIVFTSMRGCITSTNCTEQVDKTISVSNTSGEIRATVNRLGKVSMCTVSGSFGGYTSCGS